MAYALTVAKYATLVALAFFFFVVVGHAHSWVFAAMMLAAIRNEYVRSHKARGQLEPTVGVPREAPPSDTGDGEAPARTLVRS